MNCNTNIFNQDYLGELLKEILTYSSKNDISALKCCSLNLRQRIESIHIKIFDNLKFFDTAGNDLEIEALSNYLKTAHRMGGAAKISINSAEKWSVMLKIYKYLHSIDTLDFSPCQAEKMLPTEDPDIRWIQGLKEGQKLRQFILPEGFILKQTSDQPQQLVHGIHHLSKLERLHQKIKHVGKAFGSLVCR